MMHLSRGITQYRSNEKLRRQNDLISWWIFSHSSSSKSKEIALFRYLTCHVTQNRRAGEQKSHWDKTACNRGNRRCLHAGNRTTKCSVTHNKVMNIQDFSDYMLKSSKCWPHASKMKSWILHRLRSTQNYPQRWLKFGIFYQISTPCVITYGS